MRNQQVARVVRRAAIFAGLSDQQFQLLLGALRVRNAIAGDKVVQQGEEGSSLLVLASGRLAVCVEEPPGNRVEVGEVLPGGVIGDMSCLDPAPRSATVVAREDAVLYELDGIVLQSLYDNAPEVAICLVRDVIKLVHERMLALEARILARLATPPAPPPAPDPARSAPSRPARAFDVRTAALPAGFSVEDFALLAATGAIRCYADGEYLCVEGQPAASCFFVLSGLVDVVQRGRRLSRLGGGHILGQVALISTRPRSASIRAAAEVHALELSREIFERLLRAANPLALRFQRQIAVTAIRQHRTVLSRLGEIESNQHQPATVEATGLPEKSMDEMLADYAHTLDEWGISPDDLDAIEVVIPAGQVRVSKRRRRD